MGRPAVRTAGRLRQTRLGVLFAAAVLAAYLALFVFLRVQALLFPGNPLTLPTIIGGVVGSVPGLEAAKDPAAVPQRRITALIVGLDRREGEGDPGRTDSIIIATIDPKTRETAMISVPRDMVVRIPTADGVIYDRINVAYRLAELDDPGSGMELLEETLRLNFGVPINHRVAVSFEGFKELIDAVGGIDIHVETTIGYGDRYSEDDQASFRVLIPEGQHHLDGTLALAYARFRNDAQGDLGRVKRQQKVLLALRGAVMDLGWLNNPIKTWKKYQDTVEANINGARLPGYALLASQIDPGEIKTYSLGDNGLLEAVTRADGAQVLLPDLVKIRALLRQIFGPDLGEADTSPIDISLAGFSEQDWEDEEPPTLPVEPSPTPAEEPSPRPTRTPGPRHTPTPEPTETPEETPTDIPSPSETPTPTETPAPEETPAPSATPTRSEPPTPSPTDPPASPTPEPTRKPKPTKTPKP